MKALNNFVLFFIFISSIAAFVLPEEGAEFKKNTNLSSIDHNSDPCTLNPCKNAGNCMVRKDLPESFSCDCSFGYIGERCEIDGCSLIMCKENEVCVRRKERISCKIKDPCMPNPCANGGKCMLRKDLLESFSCDCSDGYTGERCEIDPCMPNPCANGGNCMLRKDVSESFACDCYVGYSGERCEIDQCILSPCKDNEVCVRDKEGIRCKVKDSCEGVICHNGGKCVVENSKAYCECVEGFIGEKCEIYSCEGFSCHNGGKCVVEKGNAYCECVEGFIGEKCEIYPEAECKTKMMKCVETGGTCKSVDEKNIMCDCPAGMSFAEKHGCKNKCSLIKCQNNGTCEIRDGKEVCKCTNEFTGKYCEKGLTSLDGTGDDIVISLYISKNSTFAKGTKLDFHFGTKKETNRTRTQLLLRLNSESVISTSSDGDDYNPCSSNPCENGARCEKNGSEAKCICPPGYSGKLCQYDGCSLIKCQNDGKCEMKDKKPTCICREMYTGEHCEIDKCSLIICQNGGKCAIKDEKAVCKCDEKYFGDFCEIDKCSMIKCLNGGRCEMRNQKASCKCSDKFTGDYCEKRKF